MPRIVQYVAPTKELTPSTRGTQAFEQAGRRIGPLYNEQAQFQKEQGALFEQQNKERLWPYDMVKLYEAQFSANRVGVRTYTPSHQATGQISRGAGVLGNMLGDGGYALAGQDSGGGGMEPGTITPINDQGLPMDVQTAATGAKLLSQPLDLNQAGIGQVPMDVAAAAAAGEGQPASGGIGPAIYNGIANSISGLSDWISPAPSDTSTSTSDNYMGPQ